MPQEVKEGVVMLGAMREVGKLVTLIIFDLGRGQCNRAVDTAAGRLLTVPGEYKVQIAADRNSYVLLRGKYFFYLWRRQ